MHSTRAGAEGDYRGQLHRHAVFMCVLHDSRHGFVNMLPGLGAVAMKSCCSHQMRNGQENRVRRAQVEGTPW